MGERRPDLAPARGRRLRSRHAQLLGVRGTGWRAGPGGLIIATDEVGSLDDVAAAVAHYPALATARLVLLTERAELHDLGRAIDEDLVREVIAVPWTPGAIGERARAQIRRWMRDHLPDDDPRRRRDSNGRDHSALLERSPTTPTP
ncbi:hypothetical protein [Actinomyces ruminis]|uniref:AMP-binding enzyme C-terminal domain-containing protein n=1 Tax=Actinomyces ruminis TaxID=1937003 RepID=A0ABX4MD57_9ACTO|nr:hypothetical protein [Actinomyces ruminis]PHP53425.1 hypothetical protein BW737_002765 [Actinomyces ruminis]